MSANTINEFVSAAREAGCDVTTLTTSEFPAVISEVVEEPAFGTPLPIENISYDETPVDLSPTGAELPEVSTGITLASAGIIDYGSVVVEETGNGEELLSIYASLHVAVLPASRILPDIQAEVDDLKSSLVTEQTDAIIATGPSATADMGAVVFGVHGPQNVHILVLKDK